MECEIIFRKTFQIREDQDPAEIARMYIETMGFEVMEAVLLYDPTYGDDIECLCGHPYYRHFDTYEKMSPVGCKYCHGFVEGIKHRKAADITGVDTSKWEVEDWEKTLSICTGFKRAIVPVLE